MVFIHQVGNLGGAGVVLADVIAALDGTVFERLVVCPDGDVVSVLRAAGATVLRAPRRIYQFMHYHNWSRSALNPRFLHDAIRSWHQLAFWRRYLAALQPDIVHLNAVTLLPLAWPARAAGAKVLCLVQETAVHGLLGVRTAWMRWALSRMSDAVVFISEFDRRSFSPTGPLVRVVPNSVDFGRFDRRISRSTARESLGVPPQARVVLFLGGVSRVKGTLPLLEAMAQLTDLDDVLLLIAGYHLAPSPTTLSQRVRWWSRRQLGRDYYERVRRFIETHRLAPRVRFLGPCDDVVPLYAAADVVAFPATEPHQARPVLEAGAMGKPVVVSDFANLGEFVCDGVTGVMVPPGNPRELARALRRVLSDAALAARLGEGNYSMARQKHDGARNRALYAQVYGGLVGRGPGKDGSA